MSHYEKIVLISLDTLRSDVIATNPFKLYPKEYGVTVPVNRGKLDDLLESSAFFANTISAAPYTSASHAAYFTGKWQKHNGIYDQFNSKLEAQTLFEIAHQHQYRTIFKTDFPLVLGPYLGLNKGTDEYFVEDTPGALACLRGSKKALAFFHFAQIHYPYGFHSLKYGGDAYRHKVTELEQKYNIHPGKINLEDMAVESFRDEQDLELLFRYKAIVAHLYRQRLDNDLFNLYLEGLNWFYEHVLNNFLDELLSVLDGQNYLIVLFGDHGEAWNDHTYAHHNASDEGVLRVPLLFYAPDIKPQTYVQRVRTVDVFPTIIEMMEWMGHKVDGQSLSDILYHGTQEPDRDAFAAVWVNELRDVIRNTDSILSDKHFETDARRSIKYNACLYKGNRKYVKHYKQFVNRSERLENDGREEVFDMSSLGQVKRLEGQNIPPDISALLDDYNAIPSQQYAASEQLRKYFKLQGYNI